MFSCLSIGKKYNNDLGAFISLSWSASLENRSVGTKLLLPLLSDPQCVVQ